MEGYHPHTSVVVSPIVGFVPFPTVMGKLTAFLSPLEAHAYCHGGELFFLNMTAGKRAFTPTVLRLPYLSGPLISSVEHIRGGFLPPFFVVGRDPPPPWPFESPP